MLPDDFDFSTWFDPSEFEACPVCSERKLLPTESSDARYCLGCGMIVRHTNRETREPRFAGYAPGGA